MNIIVYYYHKLEATNPFIEADEVNNNIATFSTIPSTYEQKLFKDGKEIILKRLFL